MYSLQGIEGSPITNLRVGAKVMGLIFTGQITTWSAPRIASINPGVALPRTPITVVYRTDASAQNDLFSQYLDVEDSGDWNAYTVTAR